jgi:putative sugar O-methyltransferase
VTGRADGPANVRGRHLLLADIVAVTVVPTLVLLNSSLFSPSVIGLLVAVRVAALVAAGVYQHARRIAGTNDLIRISVVVLGAGVAVYVLEEFLRPGSQDVARSSIETALTLGALAGYRALLTSIGVSRSGPADSAHDLDTNAPRRPSELEAMVEALRAAPALYRPSRFWEALGGRHSTLLSDPDALGTFKRTVNTSYFQFGGRAFVRALPALLAAWVRHPDVSVCRARVVGERGRRWLAIAIALYANAVRLRPHGDLVDNLVEPDLGRPIKVAYGQRIVTEDVLHSIEEYGAVRSHLPATVRLDRIIELGAGYGRLAWVFAARHPNAQYVIADIPPALFLSQNYLRQAFPDAETFRFQTFTRFADVAGALTRARFVFLEPQQLELLPDGYADLVLTVSTLHEMRRDQVENYLRLIDRIGEGGGFYTKQWRSFYNHADEVVHTRDSYPIPAHWKPVYEASPIVPPSFFEALYLIPTRELD